VFVLMTGHEHKHDRTLAASSAPRLCVLMTSRC
jgi:hypothetical protein